MINIYFEDGTVQGIKPSDEHFEYSSGNVKMLVDSIAQGRPYKYFVDGLEKRSRNRNRNKN